MKSYNGVTFDFAGKTVVVTGAGSGIFQAVATGFGEAGASVAVIGHRNMQGAEQTHRSILDLGGRAEVYSLDVTDVPAIERTVSQIIGDFGQIDILVNGAGVLVRGKSEEYPEDKWDLVVDVNCKGTFFMCREVGRHMISRGGGKIVNCSSMLAWSGGLNVASYAAGKAGVHQLTKSLCNEWAQHGVNVNAVAPGYVLTEITRPLKDDPSRNPSIMARLPVGRWGEPEDMVGPFLFLASSAADYIHGTILPVDGGWLAR